MSRFNKLRVVVAAIGLWAGSVSLAFAWPDRPISVLIPWGAGGGADQLARALAPLLERELKVPVNIVNRSGGSGAVGHVAIAQATPDGYTWGLNTVEIAMLHWNGLSQYSPEDYTIVAVFNADPGAVVVKAGGPYESADDVLKAIRESPAGSLKASGTGQGGIWHLGLVGWLISEGIDPNMVPWIPSQGSAPAAQDLAAGGIDFIVVSLPEARALIDAGQLDGVANMDTKRHALYPDVPTMGEATGKDFVIHTWRGLVGPKGIPEEAVVTMRAALKKAYNDQSFQDFLTAQGFAPQWIEGEEGMAHMTAASGELGNLMREAGLIE